MEGKSAIVTGAPSGIGRSTAELFARAGACILATDVDPDGEKMVQSLASNGARAIFLRHDVTDEQSWQAAVARAVQTFGRLDVLVNNAGVSLVRPVSEMSQEEWRRVLAVNLDGVFLGTKHAVVAMHRQGRGGSIVNVSSASGLVGSPGASAYCASKGGVRLFTSRWRWSAPPTVFASTPCTPARYGRPSGRSRSGGPDSSRRPAGQTRPGTSLSPQRRSAASLSRRKSPRRSSSSLRTAPGSSPERS
jgi:NAD(P)-dependent dehydrogenase (short-subunit alcohol dehydrogenase family)